MLWVGKHFLPFDARGRARAQWRRAGKTRGRKCAAATGLYHEHCDPILAWSVRSTNSTFSGGSCKGYEKTNYCVRVLRRATRDPRAKDDRKRGDVRFHQCRTLTHGFPNKDANEANSRGQRRGIPTRSRTRGITTDHRSAGEITAMINDQKGRAS